jgi:hypothetical protein
MSYKWESNSNWTRYYDQNVDILIGEDPVVEIIRNSRSG